MPKVGRNDPCPCGSGPKYKRCCLDRQARLAWLVTELENLVTQLGELAQQQWPDGYEGAFGEFYGRDTSAFGWTGPSVEERLEAELWIVCDCDPGAGETLLDSARHDSREHPAALEALAGSRIRPWCIQALRGAGLIDARCPISGEAATLETVRAPAGEPAPGRVLVARSVPPGEGRFALLGCVPVVEPQVKGDFCDVLAQLAGDARDCGGGAQLFQPPGVATDWLFRRTAVGCRAPRGAGRRSAFTPSRARSRRARWPPGSWTTSTPQSRHWRISRRSSRRMSTSATS
jgi:hypothetical protein